MREGKHRYVICYLIASDIHLFVVCCRLRVTLTTSHIM